MMIGLGGLKQSFGRHTSFIEADTSELFLFHQQGLETRTSGFLGSDVPSRSGSDNGKIVFHFFCLERFVFERVIKN